MAVYEFKCTKCKHEFEENVAYDRKYMQCPECGKNSERMFHATSNVHIPGYFHTSKSDIFSHEEWKALKKDPNVERK